MPVEYRDVYAREGTLAAIAAAAHVREEFYATDGLNAEDTGIFGYLDNNYIVAAPNNTTSRHFCFTLDNNFNPQHPIGENGIHFRHSTAPTTSDLDLVLVDNLPGTRTNWPKLWWDHSETSFVFGHSTNTVNVIINRGNLTLSLGNLSVEGGAVINEGSGSTASDDFRVESDGNEYMIWVDASSNRIGFGTNALQADFDFRGSAVFNHAQADKDFRVASDNQANMFFVDASTDRVGILTNTPQASLDVEGAAIFNNAGAALDFRVESDNYQGMIFVDGSADTAGVGNFVTGGAVPEAFFHIQKGDAGGAPAWDAETVLGLENSTGNNCVLQMLTTSSDISAIYFGEPATMTNFGIKADQANSLLILRSLSTDMVAIDSTGVGIGAGAIGGASQLIHMQDTAAQCLLYQSGGAGVLSPLSLRQDDVDKPFIKLHGTSAAPAGTGPSISDTNVAYNEYCLFKVEIDDDNADTYDTVEGYVKVFVYAP